MLDDALNSFLDITCDVAFDFWRRRVGQKKVELGTLFATPVEELTRTAVRKDLLAMQRESLLKRADVLHEVCTDLKAPLGSYKYDRDKIVRIDKLRQDIVHGDLLGREIAQIDSALEYLSRTWDYFFIAMNRSFDVRLDPDAIPGET